MTLIFRQKKKCGTCPGLKTPVFLAQFSFQEVTVQVPHFDNKSFIIGVVFMSVLYFISASYFQMLRPTSEITMGRRPFTTGVGVQMPSTYLELSRVRTTVANSLLKIKAVPQATLSLKAIHTFSSSWYHGLNNILPSFSFVSLKSNLCHFFFAGKVASPDCKREEMFGKLSYGRRYPLPAKLLIRSRSQGQLSVDFTTATQSILDLPGGF